MASKLLVLLEQVYRAGAAKTAVAPNSWAVICLWRRFFQLREEESERSAEVLAAALEQAADERDACPIAGDEAAQARRDCIRDYYRRILVGGSSGAGVASSSSSSATASSDPDPRHVLASLLDQAQSAQETRVGRNRPNLAIPVTGGDGRVVEHLQLAQ